MVISIVWIITSGVFAGLLTVVINGIYLYNKFKSYLADMIPNSFFNIITNLYRIIPIKNKILILIQLLILISIGVFLIIYSKKKKEKPILTKAMFSKEFRSNESRTDIDMLYRLLIRKKELNFGDIEQLFKVNNDVILGWCKILENAELALIDYPNFQKQILRLPETEEIPKKIKNNQTTKITIDKATKKRKIMFVNKVPSKTKIPINKIKKVIEKGEKRKENSNKKIQIVKKNNTKVAQRKNIPIKRKVVKKLKIKPKNSTLVRKKVANKKTK